MDYQTLASNLYADASAGDLTAFDALVKSSLTLQNAALIGPVQTGNILIALIESPPAGLAGLDSSIAGYLAKVGAVVDFASATQAVHDLAVSGNMTALASVIASIPGATFQSADPLTLGHNLLDIINAPAPAPYVDSAVAALLTKAGAHMDFGAAAQAVHIFAARGDMTGLATVIAGIPAATFHAVDPLTLGHNLLDIVNAPAPAQYVDKAVADFLAKAGSHLDFDTAAQAIHALAVRGDLAGVETLIAGVPAATLQLADPVTLGHDLLDIITVTASGAQVDKAVGDFLNKVGAHVDPDAAAQALHIFAGRGDFAGVETVIEGIPASSFDGASRGTPGHDLLDIINAPFHNSIGYSTVDQATSDFVAKAGGSIDSANLAQALDTFVARGDVSGVDEIVGHLPAALLTTALLSHLSLIPGEHTLTNGNDQYLSGSSLNAPYIIFGLNGNDTIDMHLSAANHFLAGGGGNDTLIGGNGSDGLSGGDGSNVMTGGAGADTFVFDNLHAGTTNNVTDFNALQGDKLDLSQLLSNFDPVTQAIADFVHFTTQGGNTLVSVDIDGKGSAHNFVTVATLCPFGRAA